MTDKERAETIAKMKKATELLWEISDELMHDFGEIDKGRLINAFRLTMGDWITRLKQ
jgi:hypothetical protein